MKILKATQIREADKQTIQEEQIPSVTLMERAAEAFSFWFSTNFPDITQTVLICCGPGNNGGDGLAIARMLHEKKIAVSVWIVATEAEFSIDFEINRQRLPPIIPITTVTGTASLPENIAYDFIIDGLFGTGLSRPITAIFAEVIQKINTGNRIVIAIDIPSGLYPEKQNEKTDTIIQAHYTVSFELPKLAFLLPQNEKYVGYWHVVPIGLSKLFIKEANTSNYLISPELVKKHLKPRPKFSHKGTFGHALLLAGSFGKMGAATLAARACLRSGVGLLTVQSPKIGYQIMQLAAPEAMALADPDENIVTQLPDLSTYQAIGIGPGLGKADGTKEMVRQLLQIAGIPLVIDADALNIISEEPEEVRQNIPANSILTPHPKEFERLAGKAENDYDRLQLLLEFCEKYNCFVILKGGHTCIGTPTGDLYFNNTGNPGMATGGTGDVLTGILTALVAQQYSPLEACILGVYHHGLAGDLAKKEKGEIALIASDIIDNLGAAFLKSQQ